MKVQTKNITFKANATNFVLKAKTKNTYHSRPRTRPQILYVLIITKL